MDIHQLRKRFEKKIENSSEYWSDRVPAWMGNHQGVVEVPGTYNKVYVRLTNGQTAEVFNYVAPNIYNWAVFVGRDKAQPAVWKVTEVRWLYNIADSIAYVVFHHRQHEYPAPDTVWVYRDQFMPLLVLPAGGFTYNLYGDVIYRLGMANPLRVEHQLEVDISSYAVVSGAKYVLLEITEAGALNYVEGSVYASRDLLHASPIPAPSNNTFPVCVFEFYEGQTELRRDSTERTIIDLRMFTSDTSSDAGTQWHDAAEKPQLHPNDEIGIWDSETGSLGKILWRNLQYQIFSYVEKLYAILKNSIGMTIEETDGSPSVAGVNKIKFPDGSVTDNGDDSVTVDFGASGGHVHGLARWNGASGQSTFELPDVAEYVDSVMLNGLEEDPFVYSLSSDGTQIVLDSVLTSDTLVMAHYVIAGV